MAVIRLVQFELDGHRLAVPASAVVEIVRAATPSPLPGAPEVVLGLLNLRGVLVPVFDVRTRLGFPARALRASDHLVIADSGARRVALVVDRVQSVLEMATAVLSAAAELPVGSSVVSGVVRLEDGLVVIVDLETFLTDAESARLDEALAT